jgi:nicotinate-nucleotide--dimethylbenzimidazole phosphoribosyltransferase
MDWQKAISEIKPLSHEWFERAWERLDNLTKPRKSLGVLEEVAARVVAIRRGASPELKKKMVYVFAGDHGVVEEGVSAYPQEVTMLMVKNFLLGGAAINVLARHAGAEVEVIDIGVNADLRGLPGLRHMKIRNGTNNFLKGPAMEPDEAIRAIQVGFELALEAKEKGVYMIATGEMGIGNTAPSSAVMACLLPCDPFEVTGKGTGLDEQGVLNKVGVIRRAISFHKYPTDPIEVLYRLGGLEIAGICGLCIGGAYSGLVTIVDGFISSAGALVAMRMNPAIKEYLVFSHCSSERGHGVMLKREGIRPLLDLDMRLGEGTGAALGMLVVEGALKIYREMASFEEMGITPGA